MVGIFLYYAREFDPAMLLVLVTLVVVQSKVTEDTKDTGENLLDFCDMNTYAKFI